jgi:SAM-dependent methyltransferase
MSVCRFCSGQQESLLYAKDENRRVSNTVFTYKKCGVCGTISLSDVPDDLRRYYESDYYQIPSKERLIAIAAKYTGKIQTITAIVKGGRLLEVGPAFGAFAYQAAEAGFVVDVIEMDDRCCEYLSDVIGVAVTRSDRPHEAIKLLPPHDVIALWHVLEHLAEPKLFLEQAAKNLSSGGVLVLALPNPGAFQFDVMGRSWPHLDAPRHLSLLPPSAIITLLRPFGLEPCLLTTDDEEARGWNRFGWQRLLANQVRGRWTQRLMLGLGLVAAALAMPFDRRPGKGAAYTLVLRKST